MVLTIITTLKSRHFLYVVVRAGNVLTVVEAIFYLTFVVYSYFRHAYLLRNIFQLVSFLYSSLICLGLVFFLMGVAGRLTATTVFIQPTNQAVQRASLMTIIFLLLICLSTAAMASALSQFQSAVSNDLETRYRHGIKHYLDTPTWQNSIDNIQSALRCCGASGHKDWYSTPWIPHTILPGDVSRYSQIIQPNGRVLVPLVPSSCCLTPGDQCGHQAWLQNNNTGNWTGIKEVDIQKVYTRGCIQAIKSVVVFDVLVTKIILLLMVLTQVILTISSRYLVTSIVNSFMMGRPKGLAPGWLIGRSLAKYEKDCCGGSPELDIPQQKKKKWKCLAKYRKGKSEKTSDSESTQELKPKKRVFKCLYKGKKGNDSERESLLSSPKPQKKLNLKSIFPCKKKGPKSSLECSPESSPDLRRKQIRESASKTTKASKLSVHFDDSPIPSPLPGKLPHPLSTRRKNQGAVGGRLSDNLIDFDHVPEKDIPKKLLAQSLKARQLKGNPINKPKTISVHALELDDVQDSPFTDQPYETDEDISTRTKINRKEIRRKPSGNLIDLEDELEENVCNNLSAQSSKTRHGIENPINMPKTTSVHALELDDGQCSPFIDQTYEMNDDRSTRALSPKRMIFFDPSRAQIPAADSQPNFQKSKKLFEEISKVGNKTVNNVRTNVKLPQNALDPEYTQINENKLKVSPSISEESSLILRNYALPSTHTKKKK